jgi:uncharacterized protein
MSNENASWWRLVVRTQWYWLMALLYTILLSIVLGIVALVVLGIAGRFEAVTSAIDSSSSEVASGDSPLDFAPDNPYLVPFMIAGAAAALLVTRPFAAKEGFSWSDVGFARNNALRLFMIGLIVGVASFALIPIIGLTTGGAEVSRGAIGFAPAISLAIAFLVLMPAAVAEETMDRGFPLTLLARKGRAAAILITAIVFAAMHAPNPGGTSAGAIFGLVVTGIVLALGRFATGSLWLPIGWHFGWNLSEGWLFGCVVSGTEAARSPLLSTRFVGSELLFGGQFGPEAGLLAVVADLVAVAAVLGLRNRLVGSTPLPSQPEAHTL